MDVGQWMQHEARAVQALVASGLELLDLRQIRQRYTQTWDRVGEAIERIVAQTIDREIAEDDLFIAVEQDRWMIIYSDRPSQEVARARARKLAEKIAAILAGIEEETGAPLVDIPVHHVTLTLDRPAGEIRTIDQLMQSWAKALSSAEKREARWDPVTETVLQRRAVVRLGRSEVKRSCVVGHELVQVARDPATVPFDATGAVRARLDLALSRRAADGEAQSRRWVLLRLSWTSLTVPAWRAPIVEALTRASRPHPRRILLAIEDLGADVPLSRVLSVLTPFIAPQVGLMVFGCHRIDDIVAEPQTFERWVSLLEGLGARFAGLMAVADEETAAGPADARILARSGCGTGSVSCRVDIGMEGDPGRGAGSGRICAERVDDPARISALSSLTRRIHKVTRARGALPARLKARVMVLGVTSISLVRALVRASSVGACAGVSGRGMKHHFSALSHLETPVLGRLPDGRMLDDRISDGMPDVRVAQAFDAPVS